MNNKATGLARHAARSNSLPPARNPDKIESPKNVPRPSSLGGSFTSPKGSPRAKSIGPGVLTGLRDKIDLDSPPHSPSREGNVGGAGGSLAPGGGSGISPRGVSKPPPSPGRGGTPAEQPSNKKSSKKKKEKKEDNDNPSSSKNAQRLSVSLHTDRQNVAAVVDLPIDNEEVQQRSVASARDKKSERGPLPAPGSHSQPHSDSASTIPVPARPTQRASPRSPSSISSSNTNAGSATPPSPSRIADKSSARGDLPAPGSRSTPPPYTPPPTNLQLKNINPPNSPKDHIPPPPPSPREEDNFYFEDDEEPEPPAPVAAPSPPMDPEKRERMRQEALKEIVNTERDYVKDLELVCEIFLRPLKDQPKVIPASDLNILFSNWELLEGVNKEIVKSFEKDKDNVMVGATFLSVMQFLKMYKVYCANQPQALKTLETQQQENQAFASFLQNCMANPRIKGQNLFSYLIKPIQRLCKYPLLIKVLLEHTDPSHPDHKNLAKALVEVEEIVEYVNEGKRQAEKSQKMMDLALAIDGGESLCLVTPTRIIEMEQNIEVIIKKGKPQPRKCVLFNDAILLLKEGRKGNKLYNTPALMGLGEIRVVNVSDCAEYKNGIELQALQTKEVLYVLIFGSPKDKARWMRNIKAIVKQFQRRQFEEMQKADLAPASTTPPIPAPISESPPAGNNKPRKYPSGYAPAAKPEDEVKVVKNPLLKRRSSFHDGKDKQRSVIKPSATPPATPTVPPSSPAVVGGSPTAPVVRYASKPGIKI